MKLLFSITEDILMFLDGTEILNAERIPKEEFFTQLEELSMSLRSFEEVYPEIVTLNNVRRHC